MCLIGFVCLISYLFIHISYITSQPQLPFPPLLPVHSPTFCFSQILSSSVSLQKGTCLADISSKHSIVSTIRQGQILITKLELVNPGRGKGSQEQAKQSETFSHLLLVVSPEFRATQTKHIYGVPSSDPRIHAKFLASLIILYLTDNIYL